MAEELEAANASWERTGKDLVAGAAGGIAQVLLGKLSQDYICLSMSRRFCGREVLHYLYKTKIKRLSVRCAVVIFLYFLFG